VLDAQQEQAYNGKGKGKGQREGARTMNEIIKAAQGAMIPAQEVGADLFAAFVQYIDRSEKTTRTYLTNLRQFMAWMKYAGIKAPARQDVINYREWLLSEHDAIELDSSAPAGWRYRTAQRIVCKPYTVKQYLQSVKQFFSWAAAEGYYQNIAANIHAPKIKEAHRKDSLTAQEVQTIEESIASRAEAQQATAAEAKKDAAGRLQRSTEQGKRLYAIYLLAVNAGLRTVEISRANIRDLEIKNGNATLFVWGKGHAEPDAKKPLAPAVYEAIKDYLCSRSDHPTAASPLFVSTGNRSGGKRIAPTTISTMLKQAMQAAGFDSERLTAHSLRHTAGQNVMQITGDNIYQTQMYMRHSSPKTTEIYLDNETSAQDAILAQRLFEHYHGGQSSSTTQDKLQAAMLTMSLAQLEQLAQIAAAMAHR
jgi:integrase/recombinase XerC